jgi:hypothetical protein
MGQPMDVSIDFWGIMSSGEDGSAGSDFRLELGHLPPQAVWIAIATLPLSIFPFP